MSDYIEYGGILTLEERIAQLEKEKKELQNQIKKERERLRFKEVGEGFNSIIESLQAGGLSRDEAVVFMLISMGNNKFA